MRLASVQRARGAATGDPSWVEVSHPGRRGATSLQTRHPQSAFLTSEPVLAPPAAAAHLTAFFTGGTDLLIFASPRGPIYTGLLVQRPV
jgi:hypothetical protein